MIPWLQRCLAAAAFACLFSAAALAQSPKPPSDPIDVANYVNGTAAYSKGDYATALQFFRPLANKGDGSAQFALGSMYADAQGVPPDDVKAYVWLSLASADFVRSARPDNLAEAKRKQVSARMTPAQIRQAQQLARDWKPWPTNEDAVAAYKIQDYKTALRIFNFLAYRGDVAAQASLGSMHARGEGVTPDLVSAYMWFNLVLTKPGISNEMYADLAKKSQTALVEHMNPAQVAQAEKLTREWKPSPVD